VGGVGQTIGIIGAGQLARMLIEAATPLDLEIRLLAAAPHDGAALIWPRVEIGSPDDKEAVARFAAQCDLVTFDHELVPENVLTRLEQMDVVLAPSAATMRIAQNKQVQRGLFREAGLPQPAYAICRTVEEAVNAARDRGYPVMIKAAQGGYDGRGVWQVESAEALPMIASPLVGQGTALVVEERVSIDRELAIMVARDRSGNLAVYPVVETIQADGICRQTNFSRATNLAEATEIAVRIAELVDLTGVLAVELFESNGRLLVNEIATRPHNTGHYTIEAIETSQFEQHLRAILDLPLGSTEPVAEAAVMVNVLGGEDGRDPAERLSDALGVSGARVHLYGKEPRPGRKLGHVTALGTSVDECADRAWSAVELLTSEPRSEFAR
jgi:5-(carboxyamino)imidazole ribonucleotide synthase